MRKRSEAGPQTKAKYTCGECGHVFDEPARDDDVSDGDLCPKCHAEMFTADKLPALETVCSKCGTPQKSTPSGVTCELGHGGEKGILLSEWEVKLQAAKGRAKPASSKMSHPTDVVEEAIAATGEMLAAAARIGNEVTMTWGEECFSPKQFNSFRVGPFTATTRVLPGETHATALKRLARELEAFAAGEVERKRDAFLKVLKATHS